mmetsp:Transcript_43184/g.78116  ORF Transcript_43184/g.78116 Transcript_43184/m.78116 type:complete len:150 (+) Transcript_43184:267-716(+)
MLNLSEHQSRAMVRKVLLHLLDLQANHYRVVAVKLSLQVAKPTAAADVPFLLKAMIELLGGYTNPKGSPQRGARWPAEKKSAWLDSSGVIDFHSSWIEVKLDFIQAGGTEERTIHALAGFAKFKKPRAPFQAPFYSAYELVFDRRQLPL